MEPQQRRISHGWMAATRVKAMQKSPRDRSFGGFDMGKQAQLAQLWALAPACVGRERVSRAENFT